MDLKTAKRDIAIGSIWEDRFDGQVVQVIEIGVGRVVREEAVITIVCLTPRGFAWKTNEIVRMRSFNWYSRYRELRGESK